MKEQVDEMLRDDIFQPSKSPWVSPMVLVQMKNGILDFCVNYRRLNKITKKNVYPLPHTAGALNSDSTAQSTFHQ